MSAPLPPARSFQHLCWCYCPCLSILFPVALPKFWLSDATTSCLKATKVPIYCSDHLSNLTKPWLFPLDYLLDNLLYNKVTGSFSYEYFYLIIFEIYSGSHLELTTCKAKAFWLSTPLLKCTIQCQPSLIYSVSKSVW